MLRPAASVTFSMRSEFQLRTNAIARAIRSDRQLTAIVLDCSAVAAIDVSGATALRELLVRWPLFFLLFWGDSSTSFLTRLTRLLSFLPPTLHAVCAVLYLVTMAIEMLIEACHPMLCPNWGFRHRRPRRPPRKRLRTGGLGASSTSSTCRQKRERCCKTAGFSHPTRPTPAGRCGTADRLTRRSRSLTPTARASWQAFPLGGRSRRTSGRSTTRPVTLRTGLMAHRGSSRSTTTPAALVGSGATAHRTGARHSSWCDTLLVSLSFVAGHPHLNTPPMIDTHTRTPATPQ